jgi:hypothetical protein
MRVGWPGMGNLQAKPLLGPQYKTKKKRILMTVEAVVQPYVQEADTQGLQGASSDNSPEIVSRESE